MEVLKKFAELKARGEKALIAFLPGNYPDSEAFIKTAQAIFQGGADILEIGIPFSDPLADGPVIAKAYHELVERKENLPSILASVKKLYEAYPDKAFVLMSYANPLLAGGTTYGEMIAEAGVSAVIVPDVPFEEKALIEQILPKEVKVVAMLAPTTSPLRIEKIVKETETFIYCVALTGVTGERNKFYEKEIAFLKDIKPKTQTPLVVGFGISTPEQARAAGKYADGVVIGSKITRLADQSNELKKFLKEVKTALNTR